jgi:hypothetical protein
MLAGAVNLQIEQLELQWSLLVRCITKSEPKKGCHSAGLEDAIAPKGKFGCPTIHQLQHIFLWLRQTDLLRRSSGWRAA